MEPNLILNISLKLNIDVLVSISHHHKVLGKISKFQVIDRINYQSFDQVSSFQSPVCLHPFSQPLLTHCPVPEAMYFRFHLHGCSLILGINFSFKHCHDTATKLIIPK